jgi:hypothetical protein
MALDDRLAGVGPGVGGGVEAYVWVLHVVVPADVGAAGKRPPDGERDAVVDEVGDRGAEGTRSGRDTVDHGRIGSDDYLAPPRAGFPNSV